MSERHIVVGDLVRVVKAGFHGSLNVGLIFVVKALSNKQFPCRICGKKHRLGPHALWRYKHESEYGKNQWVPVFRLKRIPPLSELEGERTEEKTKEPA